MEKKKWYRYVNFGLFLKTTILYEALYYVLMFAITHFTVFHAYRIILFTPKYFLLTISLAFINAYCRLFMYEWIKDKKRPAGISGHLYDILGSK